MLIPFAMNFLSKTSRHKAGTAVSVIRNKRVLRRRPFF